jgi:hypothetical protein
MRSSARPLFALVFSVAAASGACDDGKSNPGSAFPFEVPDRDGGVTPPGDSGGDASLGSILVVSPKPKGIYRGSAPLEFYVTPEPGTTIVGTPTASVGGTAIPLSPSGAPNTWQGTITSFRLEPSASGVVEEELLLVSAQDSTGGTLRAVVNFSFDDQGPAITNTTPVPEQITGGTIRIAATVVDRAGVNSEVVAFIGNRTGVGFEIPLAREAPASNVFSALFDTRSLTSCGANTPANLCVVFPNISFRAVDLLGNETVVAYDIPIDNQPPSIDLDPGDVQLIKNSDKGAICSHAFDPVGNYRRLGDMPNDGCGVGQLFDMRAQIEDEGNWGTGIKGSPISLVDHETVMAYVLDDTTQALAVDTNGDGVCDDVNPLLVPTTASVPKVGEVLAVRLRGITPAGAGDYTPIVDPPAACASGEEKQPPPLYCRADGSLPRAIGYPSVDSSEPAIWTVEPLTTAFCGGGQFDVHANQIADGWACIAVVAVDKVGNRSVSHPLRVYVDAQLKVLDVDAPRCPLAPVNDRVPPDCTGTFNRLTKQVANVPCKAPRIQSSLRADGP